MRQGWLPACLVVLLVACQAPAASAPAPARPAPSAVAAAPAAAAPSAAAPAVAATALPTPPAELQRVRVGNVKSISDAPIFIGVDRGFFREQGLDVEWIEFQTAGDMVPPLATDELDVGGGAFSAGFVNAIQRAIGMKIVANKGVQLPERSGLTLMVRKDLVDSGQVREVADLRGRTVANNAPGNVGDFYIEYALRKVGLSRADIVEQTLPFPGIITAFGTGGIDAGMLVDPLTTTAARRGLAVRWLETGAIYPRHETAALFYGAGLNGARQALAQRFMVAYLRGVRAYEAAFSRGTDRAEAIASLSRGTGLDPATIEDVPPYYINPDGQVNAAMIDELQDYFLERGLIQRKSPVSDLVDQQYVDYALAQLGKYQP